jgi:predicted esterase
MKITNQIQKSAFNLTKFNFRLYEAPVKTTDCVIFCHGQGERGPADGSQINLVEKLPGWPKFAKGVRPGSSSVTGYNEYPFNIIAVQVVNSYSEINSWITTWAALKFGYKAIVNVGISMGGFGVWDQLRLDLGDYTKGFVSIAARQELSEIPYTKKLPGLAWAGTNDPLSQVQYKDVVACVEAYNAAGGKVELISLEGVGHNAWDYAFNVDPAKDRTLAFVNKIFAENKVAAAPAPQVVYDPIAEHNKTLTAVMSAVEALKK